jgi:hypothetical protein
LIPQSHSKSLHRDWSRFIQYHAVRNGGFGWRELTGRGLVEVTAKRGRSPQRSDHQRRQDLEPATDAGGVSQCSGQTDRRGTRITSGRCVLFDTEPTTRDVIKRSIGFFAGDQCCRSFRVGRRH